MVTAWGKLGARFCPTESPWITQTLQAQCLDLTNKRYGICFYDMGPLPEERHWSHREGTAERSAMGLLGLQAHHQCNQTTKRLKLETPGRPKTGPKTNLISQNSERVPECEVEQSRSKQNTADQIRHYSDNSCLALVYQTVYHPAPLRYQPTITPQTVMLGGIPPSIQHGHEFLVRNLTLLLINGEWDCDVLM